MIAVVIPTYNGLEHIKVCFDSLLNQNNNSVPYVIKKDFRIILVDNCSSDDTVNFVNQFYKDVEIVKLEKNYGFAKAVNEGIKYALHDDSTSHILLLNNDIECKNDFISKMLDGFADVNVGSVACKMLNYYDRGKIDDVGDFINLIGSPYARGHAQTDNGQFDTPEYIFGACAGAALYKRNVFETAGLFDEDFFAYYEDVDFSLRLQLFGFKCYYNPDAVCYHKRGATTSYKSGFQTKLCEQNLVSLRIKNYPVFTYLYLQPLYALARIKRYINFLIKGEFNLFINAFQGYLNGMLQIPISIKKRRELYSKIRISNSDFKKLFRNNEK